MTKVWCQSEVFEESSLTGSFDVQLNTSGRRLFFDPSSNVLLIQLVRQDLIQVRIHVVYNWACWACCVRVVYMVCCVHDCVYNRLYDCVYDQVVYKSLLTQSSYNLPTIFLYNRYTIAIQWRGMTRQRHTITLRYTITLYDHVIRSRYTITLYDHVICCVYAVLLLLCCYMLCSCAFRLRFQRLRAGNRVVLAGGARVACMLGPPSWPTISTSSSNSGAFVPVVGGGMYGLR